MQMATALMHMVAFPRLCAGADKVAERATESGEGVVWEQEKVALSGITAHEILSPFLCLDPPSEVFSSLLHLKNWCRSEETH